MTRQWLSAAVGVLGLGLSPAVSSAQFVSPAVSGISAGANYNPYARNGGAYVVPRSYYVAPRYYYAPAYYGPELSYYYSPPAIAPLPEAEKRAVLDIHVPADAEIWFEGDKTSQTGTNRTFVSPALQPGRNFTYDIRARWISSEGKNVDQTRQVRVQAGQRTQVDFLAQ